MGTSGNQEWTKNPKHVQNVNATIGINNLTATNPGTAQRGVRK